MTLVEHFRKEDKMDTRLIRNSTEIWVCHQCGAHCVWSSKKCSRCGGKKNKGSLHVWICAKCFHINSKKTAHCVKCNKHFAADV